MSDDIFNGAPARHFSADLAAVTPLRPDPDIAHIPVCSALQMS